MNAELSIRLFRLSAIGLLVFATIWITAAIPGFDRPGKLLIDMLDWPLDGNHNELSQDARWLSAIGAGLTASLGVMLLLVVVPGLKAGIASVRSGALIAITVWYVVDSVGSVTAGVPSNAFFNTIFYLALVIPLWMARTD
ncbi:MAG: hypothetical protein V3U76_15780 [Granulosicoccus sp.]